MSVSPSCIHDKRAWVLPDRFGEGLWTVLDDDITPTHLTRQCGVDGWAIYVVTILQLGNNNITFKARFTRLTLDRASVDCEISKISQELLSTVLALYKFEELRSIVDELEQHEQHFETIKL